MTHRGQPGARWLRCDLHVHTPFDATKQFGEDIKAAINAFQKGNSTRLAEIAERFVDACCRAVEGSGLDLIAITDHNSIDGYRYLKPHFDVLAEQAKDRELHVPVILPGVEFSVGGERPLHFLVIFAANTDPDIIDRAVQHVFGASDRFDPKTGTPRATGQSVEEFLKGLFGYCHPVSGERDIEVVVLPAHVDSNKGVLKETAGNSSGDLAASTSVLDEMKGHLRERVITRHDWNGFQIVRPYEKLPQVFKELLWRWAAARRGKDWEELTESQRARYRGQKHWPLVECSDPTNYEAIGTSYTWLKMEVPDVEGIRLALLDPESRLRHMVDGPPEQYYSRIERIRIRNTDFFESVEIPLSPCLTTLIGGRGSGKSTVVEYLRFVLDRARPEDFAGETGKEAWETVDKILAEKNQRDFGETDGTLLPDHEVEVDVVVAGQHYRIRRNANGISVFQEPNGKLQEVPLDVRSLIAPRIFSQRQIARIAQNPAAQRTELDALLDAERLREIAKARREIEEKLTQLQRQRARLKEDRRMLPAYETELRKINDHIAFIEEAGHSDILSQFQAFEWERRWLDEVLQEFEGQAKALEEHATTIEREANGSPEPPIDIPTKTWIESVSRRIREALRGTATRLRSEVEGLRNLASSIKSEREERWYPGYKQARVAYSNLREEMEARGVDFAQHEKLLQQRADLERELRRLRGIDTDLQDLGQEIDRLRAELINLHRERLALRCELAQKLKALDADVRIEVVPLGDREDFKCRREEWFPRAGLQERDWALLVDYVFGGDNSVPDRIAKLIAALRADVEATQAQGKVMDSNDSRVVALLGERGARLTGYFFRIFEYADRIKLDEMERFLPEDSVEARVRTRDGGFKPITTGSVGERSMAILSLLLSAGNAPLIIDQPEDDLDNQYIYDVVVDLLRKRKFDRQIIVATHNANIPVNGDAELIVALGVENRLGTTLGVGSIDKPEIKDLVSTIMEGSAEAFRRRRERYGY
jgi:DNA repair ATPase RecN